LKIINAKIVKGCQKNEAAFRMKIFKDEPVDLGMTLDDM